MLIYVITNKTTGGRKFKYLDEEETVKPVLYLLCGVSGSGKSWVANQLLDKFYYVSSDSITKSKAPEILRSYKGHLSLLYDISVGISTFIKFNADLFDIKPVFIKEDKEVLKSRLEQRGGTFTEGAEKRIRIIDKRTETYGIYSGTSSEVLEYLRNVSA